MKSERNLEESYRSQDLGDTDVKGVVIDEEVKDPNNERTTEMKLPGIPEISSNEGPPQPWNQSKLSAPADSEGE